MCGTLTLPCLSLMPLGKWFSVPTIHQHQLGELRNNTKVCASPQKFWCAARVGNLWSGLWSSPSHHEVTWKESQHWGQWAAPAALPCVAPLASEKAQLSSLGDQCGAYHKNFNIHRKQVFLGFVKSWQKFPLLWAVTGIRLTLEQHRFELRESRFFYKYIPQYYTIHG